MFCNRTFVDLSNLRKHKLKDHRDELADYEAENGKAGKGSVEISYESVEYVE